MFGVWFDMPVSRDGEYDVCARYPKLHLIAILVALFFYTLIQCMQYIFRVVFTLLLHRILKSRGVLYSSFKCIALEQQRVLNVSLKKGKF